MGSLLIELWPPAKKYLKKIQKKERLLYEKFKEVISEIAKDPYIGEVKVGDLRGVYSCDILLKGQHYELAYRIVEKDDMTLVVILMCGNRENFYANLKRYLKTNAVR